MFFTDLRKKPNVRMAGKLANTIEEFKKGDAESIRKVGKGLNLVATLTGKPKIDVEKLVDKRAREPITDMRYRPEDREFKPVIKPFFPVDEIKPFRPSYETKPAIPKPFFKINSIDKDPRYNGGSFLDKWQGATDVRPLPSATSTAQVSSLPSATNQIKKDIGSF